MFDPGWRYQALASSIAPSAVVLRAPGSMPTQTCAMNCPAAFRAWVDHWYIRRTAQQVLGPCIQHVLHIACVKGNTEKG